MIEDIANLRHEKEITLVEQMELEFLLRFLYSSGARIGSVQTKKVYGDGFHEEFNPNGALNLRWEWINWNPEESPVGQPSIIMYDKGKRKDTLVKWTEKGKAYQKYWVCHVWAVGLTDKTFADLKRLWEFRGRPTEGRIFDEAKGGLGYDRVLKLMKMLIMRLVSRGMKQRTGVKPSAEDIRKEIEIRFKDLKELHGFRKAFVRYLVDKKDWHEEEIVNFEGAVVWEDRKTLSEFYFPREKMIEKVREKLAQLKGMI